MARDIFSYLHRDHLNVQTLLNQISGQQGSDMAKRRRLFNEMKQELLAHSHAEEQTFYALLARDRAMKKEIRRSEQEHAEVEQLLNELSGDAMDDSEWHEKFSRLKTAVENHVREEEGKLFRLAKDILTVEEKRALVVDMQMCKAEQAAPRERELEYA